MQIPGIHTQAPDVLPLTQARELISVEEIKNLELTGELENLTSRVLAILTTHGDYYYEEITKKFIAKLLTMGSDEFNTLSDSHLGLFLNTNFPEVYNYLMTAYPGKDNISNLEKISKLLEIIGKIRIDSQNPIQ